MTIWIFSLTLGLEHMANHGFQPSKLASQTTSGFDSKDDQQDSFQGKGNPIQQLTVLKEGETRYICLYHERFLLASKELNLLKIERDDLTAENARLKASAVARSGFGGRDGTPSLDENFATRSDSVLPVPRVCSTFLLRI